VLMAGAAAAETALERANDVRIRALANSGDPRARRIAGSAGQPATLLSSLTFARITSSSVVLVAFGCIGVNAGGTTSVIWFGVLGAAIIAVVQMTVGIVAARRPEQTALELSGIVRVYGRLFFLPAFLFGLP